MNKELKMRPIRITTLIIISSIFLFQMATVYFVLSTFTIKSMSGLEQRYTMEHMKRIKNNVDSELQRISQVATDLAAENRDDEFEDDGYYKNALVNLHLDLIAETDTKGTFISLNEVNLETGKAMPVSKNFITYISNTPIIKNLNGNYKVNGIILLPEGPMLIASCPVYSDKAKGIISGNLIAGLFIDTDEIDTWSKRLNYQVNIERMDKMDKERYQLFSSITEDKPIYVKEGQNRNIEGYAVLRDIYGKPVIGISIGNPPELRALGEKGIAYVLFSLFIVSLIFTILIIFYIDKKINSRLVSLSKELIRIGDEGIFSLRLPKEKINDEIAVVAGEVNNMLEKLEKSKLEILDSREALKKANDELERKVNERTEELSKVNESLMIEINERKRMQEKIEHLAYHDYLTNLPNRAYFSEQLNHAVFWSEKMKEKLAIMFLDLDGFKAVNDTLGHYAGDQLLEELSKRLTGALRKSDIVARMGGDEFIIMIKNIKDSASVQKIADKIIKCINIPFKLNDEDYNIGASVGIAVFPADAHSADELIEKADSAMYKAKEKGRNQYVIYSE